MEYRSAKRRQNVRDEQTNLRIIELSEQHCGLLTSSLGQSSAALAATGASILSLANVTRDVQMSLVGLVVSPHSATRR